MNPTMSGMATLSKWDPRVFNLLFYVMNVGLLSTGGFAFPAANLVTHTR